MNTLEEKLQNALNENAKLKVKQKEEEKLWKGLESKFSSTKTFCDQLTETLQKLAGLVQDGMNIQVPYVYYFFFHLIFLLISLSVHLADIAEKDKETLENKLSASSEALDSLNKQMDGLSLKLDSAQETIRTRKFF